MSHSGQHNGVGVGGGSADDRLAVRLPSLSIGAEGLESISTVVRQNSPLTPPPPPHPPPPHTPHHPASSQHGRGNTFAYFSARAAATGAVNLGQGFPTFGTPKFIEELAVDALRSGEFNQYGRPAGQPSFGEVVSEMYKGEFGRSLDPMDEVRVFLGAQMGIQCALTAFCNEGDEVLVVEPAFDAYGKSASLVGAKMVGVPLRPSAGSSSSSSSSSQEWKLDAAELEAAITPRTKMLVLNTPQTFVGKAFAREELEEIADVVRRSGDRGAPDMVVVSDEVYEKMVFDGMEQHRFASLPGMYDRTVTLFSAGKTFSCTGWRCGYTVAPKHLSEPMGEAMAAMGFCASQPLSRAVERALSLANAGEADIEAYGSAPGAYYASLCSQLESARDLMVDGLARQAEGHGVLAPVNPAGGYFLMADISKLPDEVIGYGADERSRAAAGDHMARRDWRACEWLVDEVGVAVIPSSIAYFGEGKEEITDRYVRLAFCKREEEIAEAVRRIEEKVGSVLG